MCIGEYDVDICHFNMLRLKCVSHQEEQLWFLVHKKKLENIFMLVS